MSTLGSNIENNKIQSFTKNILKIIHAVHEYSFYQYKQ